MIFNYQTISHSTLLKDLTDRQKDVLIRRFGLGRNEKETLEAIGQNYGVTRERVRQIEEEGLRKLKGRLSDPICQKVFQYFAQELKSSASLRKEDVLLANLGGGKLDNYILFLLTLGEPFYRFAENEDCHSFWSIDKNAINIAQKNINSFIVNLRKQQKPLSLPSYLPVSHVEISKNILKSKDGLYGLPEWPEINPRGVKDKAYIVMKKENKPLHFTTVAQLIGPDALTQTVHNELIKDQRFVLVGRGTYALKEWGYTPGVVREVITKVLLSSQKPMLKEKIVDKVLSQRQVQPSTVLLNLQNRNYFIKNSEGKYTIREA